MKNFTYTIKDELGIHARPAGMLVNEAKKYKSTITLSVNGKTAEAVRLMAVMGMSVKRGNTIEVEISGVDEDTAFEGMKHFFQENL